MGADQRILADRLVAKEVLRQAFRSIPITWADSGTPPDTHGEMGMVAELTDGRLESVRAWLAANISEVERVAGVVGQAAGQDPNDWSRRHFALPERIRR